MLARNIAAACVLPWTTLLACLILLHCLHSVPVVSWTVSGYFEPHAMADGARWRTGTVTWNERYQGGVMVQVGHWKVRTTGAGAGA